jgi:L-amino acid N-acyltransferase YncA
MDSSLDSSRVSVSGLQVRDAAHGDAVALADIYNPYVLETTITFEEVGASPACMAERVAEAAEARLPFLVAESAGIPVGFAYASRWKGRCAYRFTAETTVYVDRRQWRRGTGSALYARVLDLLKDTGYHAAIGGIALPNEPSIRLHERLGFTHVAHFREVGFKFNRWIDVGYWQRLFS